jgi:predicted ATPase
MAALEDAAGLCQDELLRGLYDEWLLPIRERYAQQLMQALTTLTGLYEARGDLENAIRHAEHLVSQDPLREANYQALIRLHAANRDRASALRAYHQCMRTLRRELAVEPGAATRELFEKLLKSEPVAGRAELPSPAAAPPIALVGRKKEWEGLAECWRAAIGGTIQIAVIQGEPGIGKSRLAEEMFEWCTRHQGMGARARCYAAQGQLAYAPVAEWLRSEPLTEACGQLAQQQLGELARVLPELLARNQGLERPRPLAESWERHHFYESLNAAFGRARKPLLLLIDDLQWCDTDTFEWLHSLFRSNAARQVLVLGTVRPEETGRNHPFTRLLTELRQSAKAVEFPLAPLNPEETAALATQVAGARLDAARLKGLYWDTKGNPLFVVESLRAESTGIAAAPRIHAVIAARLAQLSSTGYELVGMAGAVGQSFSFDLLAKATDWDEDSLSRALDELWQRRIIEGHGESQYDFTHDRLREVAYAELSPVRRRFLHRRIARAIEELNGEGNASVSGQLAAHYEAAGMPEAAIRHYRTAAGVARERYADAEAAGLLRRALALCLEFPETARRDEQELDLRVELGNAVATEGYAAPEIGESYTRALELTGRLGEHKHSFMVLHGLWVFHIVRGEIGTSLGFAQRAIDLAGPHEESARSMIGLFTAGSSLFHLGRFRDSEDHMRRALAADTGDSHSAVRLFAGPDVRTFCRAYLAHVLWHLGEIDEAAALSSEALERSRGAGNPFGTVISLNYASMLQVFRYDSKTALVLAEEAVAICRSHGFAYYLSMAEILAGWATAIQSDAEAGVAQLRRGLEGIRAGGAELRLPFYHGLLAEACALAGQAGEAMAHISNGFAFESKNGEIWALAELHRIHGDLLLRGGDRAQAQASYRKALESANQMGARPLVQRVRERLGAAEAV